MLLNATKYVRGDAQLEVLSQDLASQVLLHHVWSPLSSRLVSPVFAHFIPKLHALPTKQAAETAMRNALRIRPSRLVLVLAGRG